MSKNCLRGGPGGWTEKQRQTFEQPEQQQQFTLQQISLLICSTTKSIVSRSSSLPSTGDVFRLVFAGRMLPHSPLLALAMLLFKQSPVFHIYRCPFHLLSFILFFLFSKILIKILITLSDQENWLILDHNTRSLTFYTPSFTSTLNTNTHR